MTIEELRRITQRLMSPQIAGINAPNAATIAELQRHIEVLQDALDATDEIARRAWDAYASLIVLDAYGRTDAPAAYDQVRAALEAVWPK